MSSRIFLPILLSLMLASSTAQIVYEPLHSDVYDFLDRLSQQGQVDHDALFKPIPRTYIAEQLEMLEARREHLTALEQQELSYYRREFSQEIDLLQDRQPVAREVGIAWKSGPSRRRMVSYRDSLFIVNANPIYGISVGRNDGESDSHRWNGVSIFGYLADKLGFSFAFRDNREEGINTDPSKVFSPEGGIVPQIYTESNAFEYSEAHSSIAVGWRWGSAAVGKDFLNWGYGKNGQVVLSQKAPSFPFVRLDIYPTDWLRFNYFHGWLESEVVDSNAVYRLADGRDRIIYREKFIASHTLTLRPLRGLHFSIGESIVYTDQFEFAYLNPLSFFRLIDHYLSRPNNTAGNNAQLFAAISSRNHIRNTHLYTELFIDDLSIPNIFNKDKQTNFFGWTNGVSVTNLPFNNLTATVEYTRVNPFVYRHFTDTQTYQSSGYNLGHWMGSNADQWYINLNWRILRGLEAEIWGRDIRKGSEGTREQQYRLPHPPFLSGLVELFAETGVQVRYQITHDLAVKGQWQHYSADVFTEPELEIRQERSSEFKFSLYYGL